MPFMLVLWQQPFLELKPHLGSRFFLTSVTKVSISAAVMCFSSSFRLLWSSAVMVSSANTSYPICFCMKRNCLAMYSCEERTGEGGLLLRGKAIPSTFQLRTNLLGSSDNPAVNGGELCSKACKYAWTVHGADPQAPPAEAWGHHRCLWKGLGEAWRSEKGRRKFRLEGTPNTCIISLCFNFYLFQDILLPHEFLSFSVGLVNHDLQHILSAVGDVYHKKN